MRIMLYLSKFIGLIGFVVLLVPATEITAQQWDKHRMELLFQENFRLYPSQVTQTEVFIVNSPLDENILFSSCNTLNFIPFFVSEGIYVTTDGGQTWSGNDTCTGAPLDFHGGDPGIVIDKNGRFILTRLGRSPFVGLYSHYSRDTGQTWSTQQVISTDDLERASLATDLYPGSSFYGRTYASWVRFAPPFPIMFSFTDDGAESWSIPTAINDPSQRSAGGDIALGPNGQVYVCWAGVTDVSPFKEIHVGFGRSDNGGAEWLVQENAFEVNGITGVLENKDNIRVNGLPAIAVDTTSGSRKGWIYIVTGQQDLDPAGTDPDIILHRSSDGGNTWSEAIRVNQDEKNNGKTQYFPAIHVDRFGAVNVLFYDDRNTTNDSTGVMLARSVDGGDSWVEYLVSDHNAKPTPIGGLGQGYQGDNIDLTSTSNRIWPVWMDNSTGIYQVWTAPIDFDLIDNQSEHPNNADMLLLEQNIPNPFSSKTHITYHVRKQGFVQLDLFDLTGQRVICLVSESQPPGTYTLEIDALRDLNGIVGGIYNLILYQRGMVANRKIVFLR